MSRVTASWRQVESCGAGEVVVDEPLFPDADVIEWAAFEDFKGERRRVGAEGGLQFAVGVFSAAERAPMILFSAVHISGFANVAPSGRDFGNGVNTGDHRLSGFARTVPVGRVAFRADSRRRGSSNPLVKAA